MDRSPNDQEENRYKLKNLNFIASLGKFFWVLYKDENL